MTDLGQRLRRHPFVATMSDDHISTLEGCGLTHLSFEPGDKLVREGKVAEACFLIDRGDVALEMYVDRAESRTLQVVHAGEIVGWSWLIPPYRWNFQARVEVDSAFLEFDGRAVLEHCEQDSKFGYALLKRFAALMSDRLYAARQKMMDEWNPPGFA